MANEACNAFAARAAVLQVGFDRRLRNILVQCDETRIREVIDNLLENAMRMAPRNTTVVVGTEQRDGLCQLWVEDRGPGVSNEEQDLIFRRFYRSDASRSRDSGGSGLGLAICRAIAEAHGGTLNASSAEAQGTRFTLSLPAAINAGLPYD
jgi:two-component system sensor histidine kinase BaeS